MRIKHMFAYFVLFVFFISLSGCKPKSPQTEKVVLMDSWWNVDYAKNYCDMQKNFHTPCVVDPTGEVKDYERQIATAWSSDPACHGLILIGVHGAHSEAEEDAVGYQLMISYIPGDSKQNWTVVERHSSNIAATGTDEAKTTAHTICAVLTHRGGAVQ